jgi:hypothetical protein
MNKLRMKLVGHVAQIVAKRWENQRKRPLGRQRYRWVDNISMELAEIGWGGVVNVVVIQSVCLFNLNTF